MQFEKASDLELSASLGLSRTSRMQQSTMAMESQWRGLLENIVKSGSWDDPATGTPWLPNKTAVLNPVRDVIENMEEELEDQMKLNTDIMGNHTQQIIDCIVSRNGKLTGAVTTKKNTMIANRFAHADCRINKDTGENAQIVTMESDCKAFKDTQKCNDDQNWFAAYVEGNEEDNSLYKLVEKAVACKDGVASVTTKSQTCDEGQITFQESWCAYKSELDGTCSEFTTCYERETGHWNQANSSIAKLEAEQKTIFRMLGRIRCYLDLLFRAVDQKVMPIQNDIETCKVSPIDDSKTLKEQDFKVTYGDITDPEYECYHHPSVVDENVTSPVPGDQAWFDREYNSTLKDHDKLNPKEQNTCNSAVSDSPL
jgi:hypothetical protein